MDSYQNHSRNMVVCFFFFNGKNNFQYLLCYAQHKISNVLIIFRMLQHLLVNDNYYAWVCVCKFISEGDCTLSENCESNKSRLFGDDVKFSLYIHTYICTYIDTGTYCDCVKL